MVVTLWVINSFCFNLVIRSSYKKFEKFFKLVKIKTGNLWTCVRVKTYIKFYKEWKWFTLGKDKIRQEKVNSLQEKDQNRGCQFLGLSVVKSRLFNSLELFDFGILKRTSIVSLDSSVSFDSRTLYLSIQLRFSVTVLDK